MVATEFHQLELRAAVYQINGKTKNVGCGGISGGGNGEATCTLVPNIGAVETTGGDTGDALDRPLATSLKVAS